MRHIYLVGCVVVVVVVVVVVMIMMLAAMPLGFNTAVASTRD